MTSERIKNGSTQVLRVWLSRALLCGLIYSLLACSAARLGYSNGETISYWWLNSYVGFEGEQKELIKTRLAEWFAWHRKTQLRDYTQLLTATQQHVQHEVTPAEVLTNYAEIKKRGLIMLEKALPAMADLALSLQPQQLAKLEKKFASNNDKFRNDYLRGEPEKRQQFRYKKALDQAEQWFGNFNEIQRAQIRAASDARPLNSEMWLAEKQQRQAELMTLLRKIQAEKPSREIAIGWLRIYVIASYFDHSNHSAEQKAFFDASRDSTAKMVATVINLATPTQKANAVKKLQQWIDDFAVLSAKAA